MHRLPFLFLLLLLFSPFVTANVEKTIFIAPSPLIIPTIDPSLDDDLGLERLSPFENILRTKLNASFPTEDAPGTDSWYFLENLHPGQRYEQPTSFTLRTYTLPFITSPHEAPEEDPSLLSQLSRYASSRLATAQPALHLTRYRSSSYSHSSGADPAPISDSVLFLRITAAADYFSLDQSLMETVPPVLADIILDPFLGNVVPRSLVPTASWMVVVAGFAVVAARWVVKELNRVVETRDNEDEKKDQ
ncbi:hypothetical protein ARAM_005812 [Aspergillus rambellii]|uniref:Protein PBN1 n=2 Tax=Aspergillus subgen. Nidulantes TaxID=2720870 RepID=A0A0F8VTH2_9EURO|nr:hypothetical protein AOCH_005386 [Aspergillus ochraceoroseus]KKK26516.1 hypothetical protein ARAM_005812 [Aspergillus rambellii]